MGERDHHVRGEADIAAAVPTNRTHLIRRTAAIAGKTKNSGGYTDVAAAPAVGRIGLGVDADAGTAGLSARARIATSSAVRLIGVQVPAESVAAAMPRRTAVPAGPTVGLIGLQILAGPVTVGLPRRTRERLAWAWRIERVLFTMPLARLLREFEGHAVSGIAIRAVAPPLLVFAFAFVLALLGSGLSRAMTTERSSRGERRAQESAQGSPPIRRGTERSDE
jgi:hypothetical protein